jgi:hypothetical protein
MIEDLKYHSFIGISGSARSGKDTLCRALIRKFKKMNKKVERLSIAGDLIKKDLNSLIKNVAGIDTFTENTEEKEMIRPLLVEYGKILRKKTKGRYFLDNFEEKPDTIHIIPDIRYCEYEKDEIYWLKNEKNGFLIYLERENIKPANETEEKNNKIIKTIADTCIFWNSLDENDSEDIKKIDEYAENLIKNLLPLTNRTFFGL